MAIHAYILENSQDKRGSAEKYFNNHLNSAFSWLFHCGRRLIFMQMTGTACIMQVTCVLLLQAQTLPLFTTYNL